MNDIRLLGNYHSMQISDQAHLEIGQDVTFCSFTSLEVLSGAQLCLGNRVFVNEHSSIRCTQSITIGKDTMLGDGVRIFDHNHQYSNYHVEKISLNSSPIHIGKNCWIGANTIILKGVTIGDNVIIGANSLILKDIPANSIVTSKEELTIKERPQANYHVLTVTASDTLEQISYLVKHLPQVQFHIAAQTSISEYLASFNHYENVTLYTNVHHDDIFDDLLDKANLYLDINHWQEVVQIIDRAVIKGKPIFAFDNVVHQKDKTNYIFPHQKPEMMVAAIQELLALN